MKNIIIIFFILFVNRSIADSEIRRVVLPSGTPGVSNFKELRLSENYVDKSLLIKDLLDKPDLYLITRPRGWGKSLNLDMVKRFLQVEVDHRGTPTPVNSNRILFEGGCYRDEQTGVEKCLNKSKLMELHPQIVEQHQGKYPVIHFSFTDLIGDVFRGPKSMKQKVSNGIRKFYEAYRFLQNRYINCNATFYGLNTRTIKKYFEGSMIIDPTLGIQPLITLLKTHFKTQIYVLIDDFDEPLTNAYKIFGRAKKYEYRMIRSMMNIVFAFIFKDKTYTKGLLAGVTNVPLDEEDPDSSFITMGTMLDNLFPSNFGFTREEVEALFPNSPLKTDIDELTRWYNGYVIGGISLYNPSSVMECLKNKGELGLYWMDTQGLAVIKKINIPTNIKIQLNELTNRNGTITSALLNSVDFLNTEKIEEFYSILHFYGYLKAVPLESTYFNISIANEEVKRFAAKYAGF